MTRKNVFQIFLYFFLVFVLGGVNIKHKPELWKKKVHKFRQKRSRLVDTDLKQFRVIAVRSHIPLVSDIIGDAFSLPDYQFHPDQGHISLSTHGQQFEFNLTKSKIFAPDYVEYHQMYVNGTFIKQNVTTGIPPTRDCYYNGQQEINGSINYVSVGTCSGAFRGMFQAQGQIYGLEPAVEHLTQSEIDKLLIQHDDANPGNLHVIYSLDDFVEQTGSCLTTLTPRTQNQKHDHSTDDDGDGKHGGGKENKISLQKLVASMRHPENRHGRKLLQTQLYNEMLVVNDFLRYKSLGSNTEMDSANIVNTVNSIYAGSSFTPLTTIVLVGQVTWVTGDPYTVSLGTCQSCGSNEVGVDELLSNFQSWRSGPAAPPHDNGQLFSGYKFQSSVLGYADVGAMCQPSSSGGVEQTWGPTARDAAVVAHEMGHNFGMQHDSQGNACQQSGFIMNAVITVTPTTFSTCSHDYYQQFINSYSCLENVPTSKWGTPVCGNGFVEDGEQCDCGSVDSCADRCCNAKTCMYAQDAACSPSDPCCDNNCQVVTNTSQVCRAASGICDVAETCDGVNSPCPLDWYKGAGTQCALDNYDDVGQCYLGVCKSFRKQCVDDSSGLSSIPLAECSRDEQISFNHGNFCGTLFCNDPNSGSCVFLTVSGQTDHVSDGVPCDTGKQCYKSNCVDSASMQPQYTWVPTSWGDCATCETPQTREVECYYQDTTVTPQPPPRQIHPIYCSAIKPPLTQLCDNVTLGCVDNSIFAKDSINFFGVELQKYALILAVLGVFALILVGLAGCYYAVTYQSGKIANPRVRQIGKPHGRQVQQAPHSPKSPKNNNNNLYPPGSPQFLGASPKASPQKEVWQNQEWADPHGQYAIEYS